MNRTLCVMLLLFISIVFIYSCNNNRDGWNHIESKTLEKGVFVEIFYKSYGVYGGGSMEYFITDSLSYRYSIGVCDDKEGFEMSINGSHLIVEKHTRRNLKKGKSKKIFTKTYITLIVS
ncbi:MAG TPA: hypothetical protein ENK85_00975 [Saprospiraceae bacterium]|nr:hypothetical protein [Saprospiraceae bacterium]